MAKDLAIYQNMSIKDLQTVIFDLKKELTVSRLKNSVNSLEKTHVLRQLRKKIAHVSTILSSLY